MTIDSTRYQETQGLYRWFGQYLHATTTLGRRGLLSEELLNQGIRHLDMTVGASLRVGKHDGLAMFLRSFEPEHSHGANTTTRMPY